MKKRGRMDDIQQVGEAAPARTLRLPRLQWFKAEDLKYLSTIFKDHSKYSLVNEFLKHKGESRSPLGGYCSYLQRK